MKTKEVKNLLNSKLSVGDTHEQVEKVIEDSDIQFSYDKYQDQYYSTISNERCGSYQASFDESEKLSEIKVFECVKVMDDVCHA